MCQDCDEREYYEDSLILACYHEAERICDLVMETGHDVEQPRSLDELDTVQDALLNLVSMMHRYDDAMPTDVLDIDSVADAFFHAMEHFPIYELENAEQAAADHPDTFYIDPIEERATLAPGQDVKLYFTDPSGLSHGERMWVTVMDRWENQDGAIWYTAYLKSAPLVFPMNPGHEVIFSPEHVYAIWEPDHECECGESA